jgi:hypothetical protein
MEVETTDASDRLLSQPSFLLALGDAMCQVCCGMHERLHQFVRRESWTARCQTDRQAAEVVQGF